MTRAVRLGIVGDVHLAFDRADVALLESRAYDAILFVGDLAGYSDARGLEVARVIGALRTPTLVIPGNHDGVHGMQVVLDALANDRGVDAFERLPGALSQEARVAALARALGDGGGRATLAGYSRHRIEAASGATLDVVVGRPHSSGGPRLAFASYLGRAFGVQDLAASADRTAALLLEASADHVIVLAHNGPAGLGARRSDIFGCDFRATEGDFGDPDLRDALDRARAAGRRVEAVVAGHMHHRLKGGGQRVTELERDGTLFVNAARVPRIIRGPREELRHHVALTLEAGRARVEEMLLAPRAPHQSV